MEIYVQAVRVYGSKSQYGHEPMTDMFEQPISLSDYPANGETCSVSLGNLPDYIVQAISVGYATGIAGLQAISGRREGTDDPDSYVTKLSEMPDHRFDVSRWNYYLTVSLKRRVNVEDTLVEPRRNVWIELRKAMDLEQEMAKYGTAHLNRLTSYLSINLEVDFLRDHVLEGVVFSAPDRVSFTLPNLTIDDPVVFQGHPPVSSSKITDSLIALRKLSLQDQDMFDKVSHWYLSSLRERDPWKSFVSSFLGLEILTHGLWSRFYRAQIKRFGPISIEVPASANPIGAVSKFLVAEKESRLAVRFAFMATDLSPWTASEDTKLFRYLKTLRNNVSHGILTDTNALPQFDAQSLLSRYLVAATSKLSGTLSL